MNILAHNPANKNIKVIVGMSGGVDSSTTALILKKQGYDVEGFFMKNWDKDDEKDYCPVKEDMLDAAEVCKKIGINFHKKNFSRDYWDSVFEHFISEYKAGRTPNPDILCNKEVKFKVFLNYALKLGADYIATGHYARVNQLNNKFQLLKGVDDNKDQSYFLYTLQQDQLAKVLFPIGELKKPLVRQLAEEAGFTIHDKKDSTGICFIGERKFKDFLQQFIPTNPGDIVNTDNIVIGKHDGLMYHTLGQRKGLGIGGGHGETDDPWFVADKDLQNNRLIAVQGKQHPLLNHQYLVAENLDWVAQVAPKNKTLLKAKIRYRQIEQPCTIIKNTGQKITVKFTEEQTAIAPGQSIVFYENDKCLGGGIITNRFHRYEEAIK